MRSSLRILLWTGALLLAAGRGLTPAGAQPTAPPPPADARAFIPVGTVKADLMEIVLPPLRFEKLMTRMMESVDRHPDWWEQYSKRPRPLPYHKNFGITRAEYAELLRATERLGWRKTGTTSFTVRQEGEHRFIFDGGPKMPELNGVEIDLQSGTMQTPLGKSAKHTPIESNRDQKITGPWNGVEWRLDEGDPSKESAFMLRLSLGQLVRTGRGILHFEVRRYLMGKPPEQGERILIYDFPAPRP